MSYISYVLCGSLLDCIEYITWCLQNMHIKYSSCINYTDVVIDKNSIYCFKRPTYFDIQRIHRAVGFWFMHK